MMIYYKNSKNEIIDFMKAPYRAIDFNLLDSDWKVSAKGYEKKITIDVNCRRSDLFNVMEKLYKIIAVDTEEGKKGRLYVNSTFLSCNIVASKKKEWKGFVHSEVELTFRADNLTWTEELTKEFFHYKNEDQTGLDFPVDFPFDFYTGAVGVGYWLVDTIAPCDFQMVVYGPCVNPLIHVNEYPYKVYATIEEGEYMIIESRSNRVFKVSDTGTIINLFNDRNLEKSIFNKIPFGELRFSWSGKFGFSMKLYPERREPRWM